MTAAGTIAPTAATAALATAAAVVLLSAPWRPSRHRRPAVREEAVTTASARRWSAVVAVAVLAAGVALLGVAPTIVLGGGVAVVLARRRAAQAAVRSRAIEAAMPDAVELLVLCLHAGLAPPQALVELAELAPPPLRPAFAAVEQRLHRGAGVVEALEELRRLGGHSASGVVTAMGAAARDGLPLAPVLDRLTDEAVAARRRAGEAAARRLPVRLSFPLVACTLPSFVLLAIAPAVLGALSTVRGSTP